MAPRGASIGCSTAQTGKRKIEVPLVSQSQNPSICLRLPSLRKSGPRYKRRKRIEIMFGGLKDWRRTATRHDRCEKTFPSAVALAATDMFWH
jgi:transposase